MSLIFSDLVSRNRDNVYKVVSSLVDLAVNRQDFELKRVCFLCIIFFLIQKIYGFLNTKRFYLNDKRCDTVI